jgi:transcription elongation GreA/GreB family factor
MLVDPERFSLGDCNSRSELELALEEATPRERASNQTAFAKMYSRVRLFDATTGQAEEIILVYPEDVDLFSNSVSVLEPLGVAILGRKAGDVIYYRSGEMTFRFRIDSVANRAGTHPSNELVASR